MGSRSVPTAVDIDPCAVGGVVVDHLGGTCGKSDAACGGRVARQMTGVHSENGSTETHPVGHLDSVDGGDFSGTDALSHRKASPGCVFPCPSRRDWGVYRDLAIDEEVAPLVGDIDDEPGIALGALGQDHGIDPGPIGKTLRSRCLRVQPARETRSGGAVGGGAGDIGGSAGSKHRSPQGKGQREYAAKDSSLHGFQVWLSGCVFVR